MVLNVFVNFYMYYGGINFGFMNGGLYNKFCGLLLSILSYDYDVFLIEVGDIIMKFYILWEIIGKYEKILLIFIFVNIIKFVYGKVEMIYLLIFFDVLLKLLVFCGFVYLFFFLIME